jgi:hypothetical protein
MPPALFRPEAVGVEACLDTAAGPRAVPGSQHAETCWGRARGLIRGPCSGPLRAGDGSRSGAVGCSPSLAGASHCAAGSPTLGFRLWTLDLHR